jgi:hypothetical protein
MGVINGILTGLSLGEFIGGIVVLFVTVFGVFFWGSGLGWREPKKDRRNGL